MQFLVVDLPTTSVEKEESWGKGKVLKTKDEE